MKGVIRYIMCGIVGYVGNKNAQDILTSGLHRLEYRGYDSAGITTFNEKGNATLLRAKGKVEELDNLVSSKKTSDMVGIGHTRWATHGEPSAANAHPHKAGDIYLVHNGIIENYKDLKEHKNLKGFKFQSETDTEVLAALVSSFYKGSTSLVEAVSEALKLSLGTYGVAVMSVNNPDEIVVARSGSPLIIGVGEGENFIASDASALAGHTDKAIYLNDGEFAVVAKDSIGLLDSNLNELVPTIETFDVDIDAVQKQGYDHFLSKEIHEQPESIRSVLKGRISDDGIVDFDGLGLSDEDLREVEHITIIGCGTAYYAGMLASYYLEKLVYGLTVSVEIASELRYRAFHMPKNSIALVVSQSGETADTLACLREIKKRGVKTIGIINAVGSTIAREVDGCIYVHAGPEISVASTKAFTSQASAMTMLGVKLTQVRDQNSDKSEQYVKELLMLPNEIERVIEKHEQEVKAVASKYQKYDHALYLGRDTGYPVALEGALKLKELSYVQAEGYATGELKHGPIALIDDRFFEVLILNEGRLFEKSLSGLSEINARGGNVIVITDSKKDIDADTVIKVDTELEELSPMVLNVIQQLFAYYVSVARGNDVDQPRNLAKSVTVE